MNKEIIEILTGFKRTVGLMQRSEKYYLLIASFLMLIVGVLTNIPALILGNLVDKIFESTNFQFSVALPFIGIIVLVIILKEALTVLRKYLVENIATQTEKKQTVTVIKRLLEADLSIVNDQQLGSLHGRIFRSIQGSIRLIKLGFLEFFPSLFGALAALSIAVYQKPLLSTIMLMVIPFGVLIIIKQISSQKGIRVSLIRGKEKIDGAVVEMLGGIETIRVLNTTIHELSKIEQIAESLRKKEIKHHVYMALFDSVKYLNEGFFYILVISFSIFLSSQGAISRGDILVYSILFLSITGPLREIHRILDQAHESSILVNDLYALLTQPADQSFKNSKFIANPPAAQSKIVEIKNLSFTYPNRDVRILNNISMDIKEGEKIGIAGASGCGKSTLIKILLRLIHNYQGEIKLIGNDLKDLSRAEIGRQIAYIPQKTYIFSGSIRNNISYGANEHSLSDREIINAAEKANIYKEIEENLGGLNGRVSENGNNLSGGQKQRLALARLFLKSPKLIIFDEATSALDNTNESVVQRNLEQHFKNQTMITIAHRLTTLKNCDRIFVMDNGEIRQSGSFSALSKTEGLFKNFLQQKVEFTID